MLFFSPEIVRFGCPKEFVNEIQVGGVRKWGEGKSQGKGDIGNKSLH